MARDEAKAAQLAQPAFSARPGFVAVGRGMPICHRCGALAPSERSSCEVCGQSIGSSLEAIPKRADDLVLTQVRTHFTCRECGGEIPLGEPELSEAITCPRCNARQAFDASAWTEAFEHAHLVGDVYGLGGADFRRTLGARDPNPSLGVSTAVSTLELSGIVTAGGVQRTRNLRAECAPGAPICGKCGSPLAPSVVRGPGGEEELSTRCVGCGDAARYGLPKNARALAPSLVGVIAEALRTDRPEARLDQTSAGMVIALRCPNCGAGLSVTPGTNAATCSFCKTEARIASRTLLALKTAEGEASPWWAVFRGPASKRRSIWEAELSRGDVVDADFGHARGGGDPDEAQLLSLLAMAEMGGGKMISSAMGAMITDFPDGVTPAQRRREWFLQLTLPAIALAIVSPLFLGRIAAALGISLPGSIPPIATAAPPTAPGPPEPPTTSTNTFTPAAVTPTTNVIVSGPHLVLVEHANRRLPVCDDGFGMTEALVACRELGFESAVSFATTTADTDRFWLDDVSCLGTEQRLEDCRHRGWGVENCSRGEAVAVTCQR